MNGGEVLTAASRAELIARYNAVYTHYVAVSRSGLSYAELEAMRVEFRGLKDEYFARLPRLPLSRCPVCDQPLLAPFDPWGVDGFWWQGTGGEDARPANPCAHFGVLQGAVDLKGLPPVGSPLKEAFLGPGVPFVIPRVLAQRGVTAVLSSLPMDTGYVAYPIAYFASEPLPAGSFTQPWTESSYNWQLPNGAFAWRVDTDPWDFDLEPWLAQGKVLWINPGDSELQLHSPRNGKCPYVNLEGVRARQYVKDDQLRTVPPPQGEGVDPFAE